MRRESVPSAGEEVQGPEAEMEPKAAVGVVGRPRYVLSMASCTSLSKEGTPLPVSLCVR